MGKGPLKIADSFVIAIIIHIYLGWGFLYIIDTAVGHLTNNAYLGILSAMAVILPFFWIAADLAGMYPNQRISAIFGMVYGKRGGKAVGVLYLAFLIFFLAIAQRNAQLMVYTYFFRKTPFFLVPLFFLAGALYNAIRGVQAIGRLAAFMLIPPLVIIFGLEILGLQNINPVNVQPVLAGTLGQWCATTLDLPLILLPGTALFVFLPFIGDGKSVIKIGLISLGIVFPVFLVALFGTIGALSPGLIPKISWSLVEYFHQIDYPYLLLEQAGLFFLVAWYPIHFVATAQGLFVIGNELNGILPSIKRGWFILATCILVFVIVNLPLNLIALADLFDKYRRWFTFLYLGLLFGTWLTARIRWMLHRH